MNSLLKLLLFLLPLPAAAAFQPIESAQLDEQVVYLLPVATNRVTTVSFPGPIVAIDAAGVTTDPRMAGQFQLAHTKGSDFFSIRALTARASANVNVRWGKNTYVFQVEESSQPVLSLILQTRPTGSAAKPAPNVSPIRLLALLDKAKAFPLLKQQHPEAVANVDVRTLEHPISDFNDYEIRIEEAFRFNAEDTLVFHSLIKNKTDLPIYYRPDSFALRVGNRIYPQSISDASGLIPAKADVTAYFAVTGTPDGGRNEVSLKNEFTVLVERIPGPTGSAGASPTNQPPVQP